jgi:glycerol-3-phosphate dehydrogenase
VVASLSAATRAQALRDLAARELDLLVVGGGITGAGIARDAALRGLATGLVEAVDFAAGTSSRSSKLIHGGVRYLQQGDVALVREAATERAVLRRLAPHLAESLLMVMPTYRLSTHLKLKAGLFMFEKIAPVDTADRHQSWDRDAAVAHEPLLAPAGLHGAVAFVEYLTDDARLVLANVRSAAAAGALVANRAEVTQLERGRATVRDALTGDTFDVRARVIVNAAGPWVDELRRRGGAGAGAHRLQLTKGVHLVVPHARLPVRHSVVMTARDKRSIFVIPRDGTTYVGTTDTFYAKPVVVPEVTREDAEYLLEATNRTFRDTRLDLADVTSAWSGLRPLIAEEGKSPSEISRRDEIMVDAATGLVSIAGGKLTAYRKMAERIVTLVEERLGRSAAASRTADLPLPGGDAPAPALPDALAPDHRARIARLYGAEAAGLLARDPSAGGVPGIPGLLRAEVEHAVDEEMALGVEDVLERRTRALLFDPGQGLGGVAAVAEIMAARLGWTPGRTQDEIDGYRRLAASLRSFP